MGQLLALPLIGSVPGLLAGAGLTCLGGLVGSCTGKAATGLCKSCNCNSSVATRVGFSIILLLNSMLSWLMLSDWAIKRLESWSYDYLSMQCKEGTCYGVLAVHRINFALGLFHLILAVLLVGVKNTKTKRAAIQNGWWGPKILAWIALLVATFFIPNGFFIFYSRYISLLGASIFILIGLVLLVDFAHSWSEKCLDNWEAGDESSNLWKNILIGSTLSCYAGQIALTVIDYVFFGSKSACGLNQFFITFNLILCLLVSFLSVTPQVQDSNPKSGLGQSGMVALYCTYVVTSAVANRDDKVCNPLTQRSEGAQTSIIVLGALFTFLAIAYSTSRAATQSKALRGSSTKKSDFGGLGAGTGQIRLDDDDASHDDEELATVVNRKQPSKQQSLRQQALMAAVEAGSLPASALDEMNRDDSDSEDDPGAPGADDRDDERTSTRYNYSYFHIIFFLSTMYIAMLLTNWNVVSLSSDTDSGGAGGGGGLGGGVGDGQPVKIGRSTVAMWVRIVSSWLCLILYGWSLLAPVLMPDRFGS